MAIIRQADAVVGNVGTYRVRRIDGMEPKPYPKWNYTWYLQTGINAEFKSENVGYPMVLVEWNEASPVGEPFHLFCEVETDVADAEGNKCISIVRIDVNVKTEISGLDIEVTPGTSTENTCAKVVNSEIEYDSKYVAYSNGATHVWWNATNGLFRTDLDDELVSGPVKYPVNGSYISYVYVNWQTGSTHNVSAYSIDASGNTSNKVVLPAYPLPVINASITGVTSSPLNDGNKTITFTVNNIKHYDPEFFVTYNVNVGRYNSGDVGDDDSYTWTLYKLVDNVKVKNIPTNIYSRTYIIDSSDASTMLYKFKFNPVITSDVNPLCFVEIDDLSHTFQWTSYRYTPEFINDIVTGIFIDYTPIFSIYELHGTYPPTTYVVDYVPIFSSEIFTAYYPLFYVPEFITSIVKTYVVDYIPIFIGTPSSVYHVYYLPSFPTGPSYDYDVTYTPIFIDEPDPWRQDQYDPIFIGTPSPVYVVDYLPLFPTGPSYDYDVTYTPIFIEAPDGINTGEFTPEFDVPINTTYFVWYEPIFDGTLTHDYDVTYYHPMFYVTTINGMVPTSYREVDSSPI